MFKPIGEAATSAKRSPDEWRQTLCSTEVAEGLALLILGAYRDATLTSPDVFISTASAVISGFTEEIAREAFNPRTGLQTRSKWLPTISEIREACEKVGGEIANRERRRMLNTHRVLIDTPYGPKPEAEGLALLQGPDARRRLTQEEREALAERLQREVRANAEALRLQDIERMQKRMSPAPTLEAAE